MPATAVEREGESERAKQGSPDARSSNARRRLRLAERLRRVGLTPHLVRFALAVFALSRAGFILVTLLAPRHQADYIAALAVSNVAYFVALLGLAALALRDGGGAATARRAMLYLTLF